jgi:hypothetical protein
MNVKTPRPAKVAAVANKYRPWAETAVLTFTVLAIGYWVDSSNPFFLNLAFPWLILPPLLVGSKYGFPQGMASASAIIAALGLAWLLQWPSVSSFPVAFVVGLLIVTMIGAEFYEIRERREWHLRIQLQKVRERMDEFARIYHILKGSHTLLEQRLAGQTQSLRAAFLDLERRLHTLQPSAGDPLRDFAGPILELFCRQTSTHTAAIFSINPRNQLVMPAIATHGQPPNVWPSNVLLREALASRQVVSIRPDHSDAIENVLAVIPLVDIHDRIWGVIMVNEMPLFDLHQQTLNLFSVLGGRIGDLLGRRNALEGSGDPRQVFEESVHRALREYRLYRIPAAILAAIAPESTGDHDLLGPYLADSRGFDKAWTFSNQDFHTVVLKVLPLTGPAELEGYLRRVAGSTPPSDGRSWFSEHGVRLMGWCLDSHDSPVPLIREIYDWCRIAAPPHRPAGLDARPSLNPSDKSKI